MTSTPGYAGRLLRLDMSKLRSRAEPWSKEWAGLFLGGRGLASRLLYKEVSPEDKPFSEGNKLYLMSGPICGTAMPLAAQMAVVSKSPATGIYGLAMVGGHFSPELKKAGYDGIVVEGRSEQPTYVVVDDDKVEFRDAGKYWGMPTDRTQEFMLRELGGYYKTACIGPAGENLVRFAAVTVGRRTASRCGLGSVMGWKRLKAIAVRGRGEVEVADRGKVERVAEKAKKIVDDAPITRNYFKEFGTSNDAIKCNKHGVLPTRNFQTGVFEGALDISGEAMKAKGYIKGKTGCYNCHLECGRLTVVDKGPYAGAVTEGPDYDTLFSLGSNCGNSNVESVIAADMLCDTLGLDTISTGVVVSFAMECFERGIWSLKDTDGIDLRFGNHEAIVKLIPMIAYRQGIGDMLAEGVKMAAGHLGKGAQRYAMHVKGLEIGGYDPRGSSGIGFSMALGSRGGCHHGQGYLIPQELTLASVDRYAVKGKGVLVKENGEERRACDSAVACKFARYGIGDLAEMLSAVTGETYGSDELHVIGERVNNVERAYNVREGIRRRDDYLPKRFLEEPMPDGPAKGRIIDNESLLEDFYAVAGWDSQGVPTRRKLEAIGLSDLYRELAALGIAE
ncbi:MAG: aldehyde ferredoxin oxidoreductase family protein [Thaumarchaeota archaeon]|nr:aldehyde ferredoxin oxidoreductase family protein [Nitrososphaerota archaeon]